MIAIGDIGFSPRMYFLNYASYRGITLFTLFFCFILLSAVDSRALSTGEPLQLDVDPATIRQLDREETPIVATVVLKVPSPDVFICRLRSSDNGKVGFSDIIFRKGQIKGSATGKVHWLRVLNDSKVKVAAFSADNPETKLWFTVDLRTKDSSHFQNLPQHHINDIRPLSKREIQE